MYYLSGKDRKILSGVIKKVNNLPVSQRQGKSANTRGTFLYAEITDTAETTGFYYAEEIRFLADGSTEAVTDGVTWNDSSGIQLFVVGDVSTGTILRVEPFYMYDSDSAENVDIWVGSAVGGATDYRLKISSATELELGVASTGGADVIDYEGNVLISSVNLIQNLFDTAAIFSNEILYGFIDTDGNYCLDKSLLGV